MIDERDISNLFHGALAAEPAAGAFQRLQIEVESTPRAAHMRRGRRIVMTRTRMMLLAAALIALLAASVLIGTRMYRDYQNTSQVTVGHQGIDQAEVERLLARPLQFQSLGATDKCPDGPRTQDTFANKHLYGNGPVFFEPIAGGGASSWGHYWDQGMLVPPHVDGPVVVRGEDLRLGWPMVFLGQDQYTGAHYGAGAVYGTDHFLGQDLKQYPAVALDTSHPPAVSYYYGAIKVTYWTWQEGFKHGSSGCAAYQVDGPSFSETFYESVPTA